VLGLHAPRAAAEVQRAGNRAPPYRRMMLRAEGRGWVLLPEELVIVTHGMDPTAPRLCVVSLLVCLALAAEQARAARNSRLARAWAPLWRPTLRASRSKRRARPCQVVSPSTRHFGRPLTLATAA